MKLARTAVGASCACAALVAHADIAVGVTLSATASATSLGIPEKSAIALPPATMGAQKVSHIADALGATRELVGVHSVFTT